MRNYCTNNNLSGIKATDRNYDIIISISYKIKFLCTIVLLFIEANNVMTAFRKIWKFTKYIQIFDIR